MNWLKQLNDVIDYIETHLTDEIDYDKIAKIACSSIYHFQRMFSFIVGIPISEYIRRRRLTQAALDLQSSNKLVIDIAFEYGYQSPDSFTRAFIRMHGVTPSEARKKGVELKAYSRISFQLSIKGDVEMNYRILEKESFTVFGVEKTVSSVDGACYREIPEFWLQCINDGTIDRIRKSANLSEQDLLNAAIGEQDENGFFKYMICAPGNKETDGFKVLQVPKLTWAVFKTDNHTAEETTEKIQTIWKRVFPEWFPTSGYEHAKAPEFEMYYRVGENLFYGEVWVPVVKK